jgi:hypothetical protein
VLAGQAGQSGLSDPGSLAPTARFELTISWKP